jgi:hypothetical protein
MTTILISCAATKIDLGPDVPDDTTLPAKDLYNSPLFHKSRQFAENTCCKIQAAGQKAQWFIISAKHGLLHPDTLIQPYNEYLVSKRKPQRQAWAQLVLHYLTLDHNVKRYDNVIILAGQSYREFLQPLLAALNITVAVPLQGKSIGQQLRWLNQHLQEAPCKTSPTT